MPAAGDEVEFRLEFGRRRARVPRGAARKELRPNFLGSRTNLGEERVSHLRLRLCVAIGALIALVGSANAFAAGNLVVSQVYGGGGNAGALVHARLHRDLQSRQRLRASERDVRAVRERDRHRQLRRHHDADHRAAQRRAAPRPVLPDSGVQPGGGRCAAADGATSSMRRRSPCPGPPARSPSSSTR